MGDPADMNVVICVPFRDRGIDPLRKQNLRRVLDMWLEGSQSLKSAGHMVTITVRDDGRRGDAQFNRSAAYNNGIKDYPDANAFVFAEADMMISMQQILAALMLARQAPGLVIPFDEYRYLTPDDSKKVCLHVVDPVQCEPEWAMPNQRSIGALNVVSKDTMRLIGQWDEKFEGNWYDDDAMKLAFDVCCGPTRWVKGPAHHLHHLPGHKGAHLSAKDKAATAKNRERLVLYRRAALQHNKARIRRLTGGSGM